MMSRAASVDERLLKSYRSELARRTTFFHRRPKRGVSRAQLDEVQLHIDLFAAVVAHARRTEVAVGPTNDPHVRFDVAHWFAHNLWYEA